jgi:3D (Asp-Asp-Asp) domain-containing protein
MEQRITTRRRFDRLRSSASQWQKAAIGLFALSLAVNMSNIACIRRLVLKVSEMQEQVRQAEHIRDLAVRELGAVSLASALERQARAEQAAAYEAVGVWEYIGECVITAYCPCGECCGRWADGVTASGLPAGPGIVAVDPEVIPLGSTVIIDGQQYLAADTGVTGQAVDLCMESHAAALAFGRSRQSVWIEVPGYD